MRRRVAQVCQGADIVADDAGAAPFLSIVAQGLERFGGCMLMDCLKSNRCHPVVATEAPTLRLSVLIKTSVQTGLAFACWRLPCRRPGPGQNAVA